MADKTNNDMPSRNFIRGLNPPTKTLLSSLVAMFRAILRLPLLIGIKNLLPIKARLYFSPMDDSLENLTVAALNESMRLLMMSNRKASLTQMREICTAGPEGILLQACLTYVEREWAGETQTAGFFRDFHALPPAELATVRQRVSECCRAFSASSIQREPEDFDEGPMWKFNGMD